MKPIETLYGGYRFRSRLEARWSVFFDTLGIAYQYEVEGFDLEGLWYLPDFWLPELNCWIEIKGTRPTEEEQEKARRLAWYTQKHVHIFAGDVWTDARINSYSNIHIIAEENPRSDRGITLTLPLEVSIPLAKLDLLDISVFFDSTREEVRVRQEYNELRLIPALQASYIKTAQAEIQALERRVREVPALVNQIEEYKKELFTQVAKVHLFPSGFYLVAYNHKEVFGYTWMVCKKCKRTHIDNEVLIHDHCDCFGDECYGDDELLLAAYTAARQARFDGRDTSPRSSDRTPRKFSPFYRKRHHYQTPD